MIAADFNQMPGGGREPIANVAHITAGSAAQNMYTAGTPYGVQMLTQVNMNQKALNKGLKLPKDVVPPALISFGFAD